MKNMLFLLFIANLIFMYPNSVNFCFGEKSNKTITCGNDHSEKGLCQGKVLPRDSIFFPTIPESSYDGIFGLNPSFSSDGFDFPVGKPDAENYFKALEFGQKNHLGEDWNGKGGGNTDLGDLVFSVANGLVVFEKDVCCGWGNVLRIVHQLPNHTEYKYVESVYAHMHNTFLKTGDLVQRGEAIGTIGTAHGRYSAHLHLEMRTFTGMSLGPGYSKDNFGYMDPTQFLNNNRPLN